MVTVLIWLCRPSKILTFIETQGRAGIGVYSTAGLTRKYLEDFFLTSPFPDVLTLPVGGFINNIFRGLLPYE
jgi:hypothetical protein